MVHPRGVEVVKGFKNLRDLRDFRDLSDLKEPALSRGCDCFTGVAGAVCSGFPEG